MCPAVVGSPTVPGFLSHVAESTIEALRGGDAARNAAIIRAVLDGELGPRRDTVLMNAAIALIVAGKEAGGFRDAMALAATSIDSGAARTALRLLVEVIGNGVQRHRMRLRDFQFALALRAAQDFSFFHFVFVHIDFSGTFRATEHVSILRLDFQPVQLEIPGPTNRRIIYPAYGPAVEAHSPAIQCNSTPSMKE